MHSFEEVTRSQTPPLLTDSDLEVLITTQNALDDLRVDHARTEPGSMQAQNKKTRITLSNIQSILNGYRETTQKTREANAAASTSVHEKIDTSKEDIIARTRAEFSANNRRLVVHKTELMVHITQESASTESAIEATNKLHAHVSVLAEAGTKTTLKKLTSVKNDVELRVREATRATDNLQAHVSEQSEAVIKEVKDSTEATERTITQATRILIKRDDETKFHVTQVTDDLQAHVSEQSKAISEQTNAGIEALSKQLGVEKDEIVAMVIEELKASTEATERTITQAAQTLTKRSDEIKTHVIQATDRLQATLSDHEEAHELNNQLLKLRSQLDRRTLELEVVTEDRYRACERLNHDLQVMIDERDRLRQQVVDLKQLVVDLQAVINEKIDGLGKNLSGKIDSVHATVENDISGKVDDLQAVITEKSNGLGDSIDGLQDEVVSKVDGKFDCLQAVIVDQVGDIHTELFPTRAKMAETDARDRTQHQKDALTTSELAQLGGSNRELVNSNDRLSTSNRTLAANTFVSQTGMSLGLLAAGQQAQRLGAARTENANLLHQNYELSREKRTLEQDIDDAVEELQRSRRRRTETPNEEPGRRQDGTYGHLTNIKVWTGTEEKDFHDLSTSVKDAVQGFIGKHVLGEGWYRYAQKGRTSCARNKRMDRCDVPQENPKVACSKCVGGKTFCIRRRADGDETLSLFPLHPEDRDSASIDDVGFWMTPNRKTRSSFYNTKLYAREG